MARARNIKPGFFIDGDLGELNIYARMLFAGLWCLADREGRLKDKPKDIKVQILPFDDVDVDSLLDSLCSKFITRYEVDGERYIQVNNFKKHQKPHKNETESEIPPAQEHVLEVSGTLAKLPEHSGNYKSTRADSLIPDSLIPDSLIPENNIYCPSPQAATGDTVKFGQAFDSFWQAYPKKVGITKCRDKFKSLVKNGVPPDSLIAGAKRYADWCARNKKEPQYMANPYTWLTQGRWDDELLDDVTPLSDREKERLRAKEEQEKVFLALQAMEEGGNIDGPGVEDSG